MPRSSLPLPPWLTDAPFHLETGLDAGMPRARLKGPDLTIPSRGVRVVRTLEDNFVTRVRSVAPVLPPTGVFSHVTGARLFDLPVTSSQEERTDVEVIDVGGAPQVRRRGVTGHRGRGWRRTLLEGGLPVVAPIDTWIDFGELVRRDSLTLDDFVVLGDAVLNVVVARPELAGLSWGEPPETRDQREQCAAIIVEEMRATLQERVRPRGKRHLEAALPLIRFGVRSPMESRTRLVFHWAGLPEPRINADIINRHGEWLGEGDLVWPGVVVEYQGAHHANRRRRSNDSARREAMGDDQVRVFEAFAEDVYQAPRREALVDRVARALHVNPTPREHPFAQD